MTPSNFRDENMQTFSYGNMHPVSKTKLPMAGIPGLSVLLPCIHGACLKELFKTGRGRSVISLQNSHIVSVVSSFSHLPVILF